MPVVSNSTFNPAVAVRNPHIQTLAPYFFRKIKGLRYQRERILTPDSDFLDVDWSVSGSNKLIIISHGLEGSSRSSYVRGFANTANQHGWDVLAWNMRGCSGEANAKLQSYHSGSTDDLQVIFSHALFRKNYDQIALVGFSLGGNITLKFLGEQGDSLSSLVSSAVCISVPCDLEGSAKVMQKKRNFYYMRFFARSLQKKIRFKRSKFPHYLGKRKISNLKTFTDIDNYYTAPVHGYRNAQEYWYQCSANRYLSSIKVPTLLLNALDDPFLSSACYPYEIAQNSDYLTLETPNYGGHVGFIENLKFKTLWSEDRALQFFSEQEMLINQTEDSKVSLNEKAA